MRTDGITPNICHCGRPVIGMNNPIGEYMNTSLREGYCIDCAHTRCDAFPQDCVWKEIGEISAND